MSSIQTLSIQTIIYMMTSLCPLLKWWFELWTIQKEDSLPPFNNRTSQVQLAFGYQTTSNFQMVNMCPIAKWSIN